MYVWIFLHPSKQDSSVGKDQRLIRSIPTIKYSPPEEKNWIPLESGQTKSVELFCDHSSRRLRSSPRAHRYCKITAGGSITMSSSCSAVPTHSPFRSERSDSLGTTRDLRQGGEEGGWGKGGGEGGEQNKVFDPLKTAGPLARLKFDKRIGIRPISLQSTAPAQGLDW